MNDVNVLFYNNQLFRKSKKKKEEKKNYEIKKIVLQCLESLIYFIIFVFYNDVIFNELK